MRKYRDIGNEVVSKNLQAVSVWQVRFKYSGTGRFYISYLQTYQDTKKASSAVTADVV